MSAATPTLRVQRWSPLSLGAVSAAALSAALIFVPAVLSAHATEKLTGLFVLIILAAMWNVLAGYAGLVSVGQQAFIGIGAYGTIVFADHGYGRSSRSYRGGLSSACSRCRFRFVLRLRGGQFAIGMWVMAEVSRSWSSSTRRRRRNRDVADRAQRLRPTRPALHILARAGGGALPASSSSCCCAAGSVRRSRRSATMRRRPHRRRAGHSRPSGSLFVLAAFGCGAAGALTLANTLFVQPDSIFSVQWTAYMIFMVLVGGLGTFEGPMLGALVLFVIQEQFVDQGAGTWSASALPRSCSRSSCRAVHVGNTRGALRLRLFLSVDAIRYPSGAPEHGAVDAMRQSPRR